MLDWLVAVCLVELGLSIKAIPPAGEDPAAREDQPQSWAQGVAGSARFLLRKGPQGDERRNSERPCAEGEHLSHQTAPCRPKLMIFLEVLLVPKRF